MPRKSTAKANPDEYKRFLEAAKKAAASDDPKDFERAFERVVGSSDKRSPKK